MLCSFSVRMRFCPVARAVARMGRIGLLVFGAVAALELSRITNAGIADPASTMGSTVSRHVLDAQFVV